MDKVDKLLRAPRFWRTLLLVATFAALLMGATTLQPLHLSRQVAAERVAEAVLVEVRSVETQSSLPAADLPLQVGRQATGDGPALFDELIRPFRDAALKRRAERAQSDPGYAVRVDTELNAARINFLLFGWGETYEPPHPADIIGSITILSLDYRSRKFAQISLTHDARAPEIERYLASRGMATNPSKIDQTYKIGGFGLMREAVENATGLAIDFQVVMEDSVIRSLVDDVLGTIEVESPFELATNPIYIHGQKFPGAIFHKGRQNFDGLNTMVYLKGLALPPYDPTKENNIRKHIVFRALSTSVQQNITNPLVALKALSFVHAQLDRKAIAYDFDVNGLILDAIGKLASTPSAAKLAIPSIDQNLYLVDQQFGDGGFTWVMGTQNPVIKNELKRGIYKDTAMVVPSGDPYASNLATGYWISSRQIVKNRLIAGAKPQLDTQMPCPNGDMATAAQHFTYSCGN